jgi:crossover junction endodeoxyribonuclease RuvC
VESYAPNRVKQAVTNSGHAGKQQVGRAVQAALGLATVPQPADVTDALAIALCHAQSLGRRSALARTGSAGRKSPR